MVDRATDCSQDVIPDSLITKARKMYLHQGPWATTRWLKNQGFGPEEATRILHAKTRAEVEFEVEMRLACKKP